jgi:hypothetical protein
MAYGIQRTKKVKDTEGNEWEEYSLKPNDSHKSFYGKAHVIQRGDKKILRSYDTDVAEIEDGKAKVKGLYSQTTTRHIKAFLIENGFKAESSKQIMADYGVKE